MPPRRALEGIALSMPQLGGSAEVTEHFPPAAEWDTPPYQNSLFAVQVGRARCPRRAGFLSALRCEEPPPYRLPEGDAFDAVAEGGRYRGSLSSSACLTYTPKSGVGV